MGNGGILDDLYPGYSYLLFCVAVARFLEHGQIFLVSTLRGGTNFRGSTRLAQGENGKAVIISDEGRFDPRSIPKRKWEEYEADMLDVNNDGSRSEVSGHTGRQSMRTSMFVPTVDQRGRMSRVMDQQNFYDNPPPVRESKHGKSPLARESLLGNPLVTLPGGEVVEMQEAPIHASQRLSRPMMSQDVPAVGLPSDGELLAEIRRMLESADLMTVTKKDVKTYLESVFGVPLDVRREYINQCTEAVLSGRL
jgi:chitin synthase